MVFISGINNYKRISDDFESVDFQIGSGQGTRYYFVIIQTFEDDLSLFFYLNGEVPPEAKENIEAELLREIRKRYADT